MTTENKPTVPLPEKPGDVSLYGELSIESYVDGDSRVMLISTNRDQGWDVSVVFEDMGRWRLGPMFEPAFNSSRLRALADILDALNEREE